MVVLSCSLLFFFKQKTAYELRISDWSSDVCSSDLLAGERGFEKAHAAVRQQDAAKPQRHQRAPALAVEIRIAIGKGMDALDRPCVGERAAHRILNCRLLFGQVEMHGFSARRSSRGRDRKSTRLNSSH